MRNIAFIFVALFCCTANAQYEGPITDALKKLRQQNSEIEKRLERERSRSFSILKELAAMREARKADTAELRRVEKSFRQRLATWVSDNTRIKERLDNNNGILQRLKNRVERNDGLLVSMSGRLKQFAKNLFWAAVIFASGVLIVVSLIGWLWLKVKGLPTVIFDRTTEQRR